ncbi:MAG: hypothetical protein HUU32_13345 [Calditrichaceae bacterium]|nr:hypothetical protein [Calditrichia bacterium]NUQ42372.1 hypothetical protein [Calditrichaceae bacterium]
MQKKNIFIIGGIVLGVALLVLILWLVLRKDLSDQIAIPYISHQKPVIDPHLPHAVDLSDKLDEVLFDGLFNISANPSGIIYEDGLGEFIGIDANNVVSVRLNTKKKWHSSFNVQVKKDDVTITPAQDRYFSAEDLRFTLRRIRDLGSLSPDYILVSQALQSWDFEGPDANGEIRFQFKSDRIWTDADIMEVLSFKIIPANSDLNVLNFYNGSGPYLALTPLAETSNYYRSPAGSATISRVNLKPYIDNSTYTTEFKNNNFNVLLSTPFGSLSPILENPEKYFYKSNISTTFFALLFNTQRLSQAQRKEARKLFNNRAIVERFYKVNTQQQRHITDYKGNSDNYSDYLNRSVFPSSTYYVEEEIVAPPPQDTSSPDLSLLPDTLRIVGCLNYGHREEYADLLEILNDPALTGGRVRALAVANDAIKRGDYDALLIAIDGYRSTFLFDLYNIFLREPDLETYKINLATQMDAKGASVAAPQSFQANNNFCRLDAARGGPEQEATLKFLEYMYGFMHTNHIGDKQVYAQYVDQVEQELALGAWLFSLPSLAYFRTQFEAASIDLYGVASQLSTIEKWRERVE